MFGLVMNNSGGGVSRQDVVLRRVGDLIRSLSVRIERWRNGHESLVRQYEMYRSDDSSIERRAVDLHHFLESAKFMYLEEMIDRVIRHIRRVYDEVFHNGFRSKGELLSTTQDLIQEIDDRLAFRKDNRKKVHARFLHEMRAVVRELSRHSEQKLEKTSSNPAKGRPDVQYDHEYSQINKRIAALKKHLRRLLEILR